MGPRALGDGSVIDIHVDVDPRDQEIEQLRAESRRLQRAVRDAELQTERAREDADRALSNLRRQLSPLYRALQMVFGELDAAGIQESAPASAPAAAGAPAAMTDPRVAAVWASWKEKLPPACGKVIDALLVHGDLNYAQIKVAAGMGSSTVSDSVYKLNKAGLITKNGGRISLKVL